MHMDSDLVDKVFFVCVYTTEYHFCLSVIVAVRSAALYHDNSSNNDYCILLYHDIVSQSIYNKNYFYLS